MADPLRGDPLSPEVRRVLVAVTGRPTAPAPEPCRDGWCSGCTAWECLTRGRPV